MGGFHATLCPDEVAQYAEAVVVGEAEALWPRLIDDFRHGAHGARSTARAARRRSPGLRPDRRIFRGKRYLPIGLVEAGRGCHFQCDFCAVQTVFGARRPAGRSTRSSPRSRRSATASKLFFFVDDNITSNLAQAKEFFRALAPLGIRWVSQSSINAAHDEEFLELLVAQRLPGRAHRLREPRPGEPRGDEQELQHDARRLRGRAGEPAAAPLRLYGTFIFGYDGDTPESFRAAVAFADAHRLLHRRVQPPDAVSRARRSTDGLRREGPPAVRALVARRPLPLQHGALQAGVHGSPEALQRQCLEARRTFYGWPSIVRRGARSR